MQCHWRWWILRTLLIVSAHLMRPHIILRADNRSRIRPAVVVRAVCAQSTLEVLLRSLELSSSFLFPLDLAQTRSFPVFPSSKGDGCCDSFTFAVSRVFSFSLDFSKRRAKGVTN